MFNSRVSMRGWRELFSVDPLPSLLSSGDAALVYFTRRDLLGEDPGPIDRLWELPAAKKILKNQLPDGSWSRSGEQKHPAINYGLIETWRCLSMRGMLMTLGLSIAFIGCFLCANPTVAGVSP